MVDIIGYLAGTLISISLFPQMIHTIKSKDTKGISLAMYSIYNMGVVFFILYGIMLPSLPVAITNSIALLPASVILFLKIKNNKKDNQK